MALNDREQIHHQLLDALYTAKKQVEYLEAALAHNAAYLGTGVEREGKFGVRPEDMVAPDALIRYLELVEPESDISDYIGSEGVDHSRPKLGPDAPASIRPNKQPPVNAQVGNVALGHPDDFLAFPFKAGSPPPGAYIETSDRGDNEKGGESLNADAASPSAGQPLSGIEEAALAPPPQAAFSGQNERAPIVEAAPMLVENVPTPQGPRPAQGPRPVQDAQPARQSKPMQKPVAGGALRAPLAASLAGKDDQAGHARPVTDEDCLRAHNAMAALNYGLWDWNMRSGNIFISSRWEELMGRPPAGLASALDALTCSLHPEDAKQLKARLKSLQGNAASSTMSMAARYRKNSGKESWSKGRVHAAFQRQGGKAVRLTAVFSDEAPEEPERPARDRVGNFFAGMEEAFALFERRRSPEAKGQAEENFVALQMNEAFKNMWGLEESREAEPPLERVVTKGLAEWRRGLASVLRDKKPVRLPLVSARDRGLYEISLFSPGEALAACIAKNITEPYRLEQEGRRNEARLSALYRLSHMDDYSEDRMVRYCLGEAVRLTGSEFGYVFTAPGPGEGEGHIYWSSELLAKAGKEPAPPHFCGASWTSQSECLSLHGPEVVNTIKDVMSKVFGGAAPISRYMLIPVMDGGRVRCVAAVANKASNYEASDQRQLDLFINGMWFHLQRRRAVEELQRAKEAAEAANQAKNEFLANISHELRTPLNGILGMLQALEKSEMTKEQTECVRTAFTSGRSLLRVISDILDFARMESGCLELVRHPFDFAAAVRATLDLFAYEAERRKIALSCDIAENVPRSLLGDEARVRQILFNLVGNAVKFTPQGEIRVECELLPYKKEGRPCIYLAVHDSGIGISPEKQHMIFQAFTQIDGSSTRRYSGAGIGLAIVGKLARLMGGSITVESAPGEGTTIHCSLPFDEARLVPPPQETSISPSAVSLEILAVEDDLVNQFTLRTLLKKAGHSVVCAPNGRQAVEALLLRDFHCVITDIQMPVMDGGEFVRRIREGRTDDVDPSPETMELLGLEAPVKRRQIRKDIPIVALTAHALAGDRERFLAMGIDYYLSKPLSAAELDRVLSRIGNQIHAQQQ